MTNTGNYADTPRAVPLLSVQKPKQRGGKDYLKNRNEGGHNGYGLLNGNNLTDTLSKNLTLFFIELQQATATTLPRLLPGLPKYNARFENPDPL